MGDRALCRDPVMLEIEFLILKTAQLHSSLHPQGSSSESWRITLKLQPQMCWKASSEAEVRTQKTQPLLPLVQGRGISHVSDITHNSLWIPQTPAPRLHSSLSSSYPRKPTQWNAKSRLSTQRASNSGSALYCALQCVQTNIRLELWIPVARRIPRREGEPEFPESSHRSNCPWCLGKWDNLIGQNSINHPLRGLPCASFLFYPSWPLKFLSEQICLEQEAHTINPAQSTNSRAPGPPPAPPELLFSHKHGRWTMNRAPLSEPQLRAGWGERQEIFIFLSL